MPHATLPSPSLQALILCGPGLNLPTFTSNPSDLPKALLPIANRPMIWYPLQFCHSMGITDITLITAQEAKAPIEVALGTHPALTTLKGGRPDVLAPEGLSMTSGTGEILSMPEVRTAVTGDFVVLPCDFVCEVAGHAWLQQWLTLNPSSSSARKGGLAMYYPTHNLEGISHKKDETDFVATVPVEKSAVPSPAGSLREGVERIVMAMPTDTLKDVLDENKGILPVRQKLMEKHGRVKMRTKHRDAHVYIFPRWVLDFVAQNEGRFESISEDVVGWWAKAGWQDGLIAKLGLDEVLADQKAGLEESTGALNQDTQIDVNALSSTKARPKSTSQTTNGTSPPFATRVGNAAMTSPPPEARPTPTVPPLLAYVQPAPPPSTPTNQPSAAAPPPKKSQSSSRPTDDAPSQNPHPLIRRVDTAAQLASISLYLARQTPSSSGSGSASTTTPQPFAAEHKIHPTSTIGQQSRISAEDTLIDANVSIGVRCNVKESVIGANCEIGNNVRLLKCVLMDSVVVGDGVQMTGCIVGRRARIEGIKPSMDGEGTDGGKGKGKKRKEEAEAEEKTKLTDCEVANYFVVESGTEAKGEMLRGFEGVDDGEDEDAAEGEGEDGGDMEA